MLLLVVQPRTKIGARAEQARVVGRAQPVFHPGVDLTAVAPDLADGRPREQPSAVAGDPLADRVVIRVEQEVVLGEARPIIGQGGREDEGLEEPGGVGQMPLDRAGVGHRLDDEILGLERLGQESRSGAGRPGTRPGGRMPDGLAVGGRGRLVEGSDEAHGRWSLRRRGRDAGRSRSSDPPGLAAVEPGQLRASADPRPAPGGRSAAGLRWSRLRACRGSRCRRVRAGLRSGGRVPGPRGRDR